MINVTYSTLSNRRNGCNKQNGVQKLNHIKFLMGPISITVDNVERGQAH